MGEMNFKFTFHKKLHKMSMIPCRVWLVKVRVVQDSLAAAAAAAQAVSAVAVAQGWAAGSRMSSCRYSSHSD